MLACTSSWDVCQLELSTSQHVMPWPERCLADSTCARCCCFQLFELANAEIPRKAYVLLHADHSGMPKGFL